MGSVKKHFDVAEFMLCFLGNGFDDAFPGHIHYVGNYFQRNAKGQNSRADDKH